eukprot:1141173-Alexandrium_andersonii.AAC.1
MVGPRPWDANVVDTVAIATGGVPGVGVDTLGVFRKRRRGPQAHLAKEVVETSARGILLLRGVNSDGFGRR